MAYCTLTDLKNQIPEETIIGLTDDEGAGIVNEARVTEAIAKADALIDSYCGQVATVPFTTISTVIKQHSITLAIYYLYTRRAVAPEIIKENYKDAIKHLGDISTGKAAIGATTAADYEDEVSFESEDRIFTRDKLKDF
jgi:phage gp36-like protein